MLVSKFFLTLHVDSRYASSKRGSEARGNTNKKAFTHALFLLTENRPVLFATKNNAKVDAHGYVNTYPGSFLALWHGVSFGWLYIPA